MVELGGQAMFFNMKNMTIIASFPINYRKNFAYDHKPTDKDKIKAIASVYQSEFGGPLNVFIERINSVRINELDGNTFQVTKVMINSKAKNELPKNKARIVDSLLAQSFSKYLAANQNVPMIPFVKGYTVGNKIPGRFADGRVFNLSLPDADYQIELNLKAFKKKLFSQNNVEKAYRYGTIIGMSFKEPVSGSVYLESDFVSTTTKVVPVTQNNIEDWPVYRTAVELLFHEFTTELSSPSKRWVKDHAFAKDARAQMKTLKKKMELSR